MFCVATKILRSILAWQLSLKIIDEENGSDEIDASSDAPFPISEETPDMAPEPKADAPEPTPEPATPPADDSGATFTSVAGTSVAALALALNYF